MTDHLKTADDFDNPFFWDAYALAVFANRLNPRVDIELGMDSIMGFFEVLITLDSEPTAQMFQELADELIKGGSPSLRDH